MHSLSFCQCCIPLVFPVYNFCFVADEQGIEIHQSHSHLLCCLFLEQVNLVLYEYLACNGF